jgi:predicted Zn finger-like uncharacterized protein
MLIVCPNCATSYMIDPASVGTTGRSVRCARCKSTWFATAKTTAAPPAMSAFVDGVIAEAEAETKAAGAPLPRDQTVSQPANPPQADADDFGAETAGDFPPQPGAEAKPAPFGAASQNSDLAPRSDETFAKPTGEHAVAMEDAPSLVPSDEHDAFAAGNGSEGHNIEHDAEEAESFVARRQRLKAKRQKSKRNSRWTAVVLVLFAFNVALIGARGDLVRYLPQTASLFAAIGLPVNLRNLKFDQVKITKETTDGVSILVIEGMIVNTAAKPTDVPRLRFAARNASGQDVYTWTMQPARAVLGPNESMEFHSRLAAPPADAHDVMVRFFTAQDAAAGAK